VSQRPPDRSNSRSAIRLALTIIGGGALILGSFLIWLRRLDLTLIQLNHRIFYKYYLASGSRTVSIPHSKFLTSAGILMILLGVIAIAGLALRNGWLTVAAGLVAIIAVVLFVIVAKGAPVHPQPRLRKDIGIGVLVSFIGGVVAIAGGVVDSMLRRGD
jgi:hypothetical protein